MEACLSEVTIKVANRSHWHEACLPVYLPEKVLKLLSYYMEGLINEVYGLWCLLVSFIVASINRVPYYVIML